MKKRVRMAQNELQRALVALGATEQEKDDMVNEIDLSAVLEALADVWHWPMSVTTRRATRRTGRLASWREPSLRDDA
jgi:hypothetical protein